MSELIALSQSLPMGGNLLLTHIFSVSGGQITIYGNLLTFSFIVIVVVVGLVRVAKGLINPEGLGEIVAVLAVRVLERREKV